MKKYSALFAFLTFLKLNQCARILGIFPTPSISHQIIFQPIWKELSLRGHDVTVITPNPLQDPTLTNLTEIDISFTYGTMVKLDWPKKLFNFSSIISRLDYIHSMGAEFTEEGLKYEPIQKMINDTTVNFDLVMVQQSHNMNLFNGYTARFTAPVVDELFSGSIGLADLLLRVISLQIIVGNISRSISGNFAPASSTFRTIPEIIVKETPISLSDALETNFQEFLEYTDPVIICEN